MDSIKIQNLCRIANWERRIVPRARNNFKTITVSRLEELRVLTQYLFQSISNSFRSKDDLKYETSRG